MLFPSRGASELVVVVLYFTRTLVAVTDAKPAMLNSRVPEASRAFVPSWFRTRASVPPLTPTSSGPAFSFAVTLLADASIFSEPTAPDFLKPKLPVMVTKLANSADSPVTDTLVVLRAAARVALTPSMLIGTGAAPHSSVVVLYFTRTLVAVTDAKPAMLNS